MSVNKVQLANGETIIDISDSTVTPETLAEGVTAHDASGQKITGKMIPGGGRSVQSDWNQTDETAADFIKNKPFGELEAVLVEEQTFTPSEQGNYLTATDTPSIGSTVVVVLDGETFECEVKELMGLATIGDGSAFGGSDTGEPFFIGWLSNKEVMVYVDDATKNHNIYVTGLSTNKIPDKYYDVYKLFYVGPDKYLYKDAGCSTTVTRSELEIAVRERPIMLCVMGSIFFQGVSVKFENTMGVVSVDNHFDNVIDTYYTTEYTGS